MEVKDLDIENSKEAFGRFLEVIKRLRSNDGCPWDKDQTPLSMRQPIIEEAFEAIEAISENDSTHAREELGDVFLNVMLTAYIYQQQNDFSIEQTLDELTEKLIRRHPHIFNADLSDEKKLKNSKYVLIQWDKIKEDAEGRAKDFILDEVPKGFSPLLKAYKFQKKAAKKGFDWEEISAVEEKIIEELEEVKEAKKNIENSDSFNKNAEPFTVSAGSECNEKQLELESEVGDLLFAVVNYARHLGIEPNTALSRANEKFYRRFKFVNEKMKESNLAMDKEHFCEQDAFWEEAKKAGF